MVQADTDGDGIADVVDDVVGFDVNDADVDGSGTYSLTDTDGDVGPDGSGANGTTNNLDFRDNTLESDYVVDGTSGDDLIDGSYTGDPDGDRVDASDASDGSEDDLIYGYDGSDTILGGDGNDTIYGGGDPGHFDRRHRIPRRAELLCISSSASCRGNRYDR